MITHKGKGLNAKDIRNIKARVTRMAKKRGLWNAFQARRDDLVKAKHRDQISLLAANRTPVDEYVVEAWREAWDGVSKGSELQEYPAAYFEGKTCGYLDALRWVGDSLGVSDVNVTEAPGSMAWGLYVSAKNDKALERSIWNQCLKMAEHDAFKTKPADDDLDSELVDSHSMQALCRIVNGVEN